MKALLISFLILPFSLFSQDWKVISVGKNSNYYIRKHSENPDDTKVWIKEEGPKIEYTTAAGKKLFIKGRQIVLWDINCDDKQIALVSRTVYNSVGTVLNNTIVPSYAVDFQYVIPDSKGELWLNEACHVLNPEEVEVEEESVAVDTVAAEELVENVEPITEVETLEADEDMIEESDDEKISEEEIYTAVEQPAKFPGGISAWNRYIGATLIYPPAAKRAKKEGRAFVSFVINTDGSIQDVQILNKMGYGFDEEAIRVIKAMPKWAPAKQGGKTVRSRYTQPISFVLP